MSFSLKSILVISTLVLAACGGHPLNATRPVSLLLLPPAEGAAAELLKQKITMIKGSAQQQFLAVLRFEPHQLKLVVLSAAGQRLLSLDYDGKVLRQENDGQIELPGREILAIMQFARWPEESIRAHYNQQDGWIVESDPSQRILLTASGVVLKISYQPEALSVENYLQGYRVVVNTLERTKL